MVRRTRVALLLLGVSGAARTFPPLHRSPRHRRSETLARRPSSPRSRSDYRNTPSPPPRRRRRRARRSPHHSQPPVRGKHDEEFTDTRFHDLTRKDTKVFYRRRALKTAEHLLFRLDRRAPAEGLKNGRIRPRRRRTVLATSSPRPNRRNPLRRPGRRNQRNSRRRFERIGPRSPFAFRKRRLAVVPGDAEQYAKPTAPDDPAPRSATDSPTRLGRESRSRRARARHARAKASTPVRYPSVVCIATSSLGPKTFTRSSSASSTKRVGRDRRPGAWRARARIGRARERGARDAAHRVAHCSVRDTRETPR